MKKKILIQQESYEYICESCNKKVLQNGEDISLIQNPENKADYLFHFHTTCLVEHLKKTFIPNP